MVKSLFLVWLYVFVSISTVVYALPSITVSPNPTQINVLNGQSASFSVNITNTGDQDLYNLSFSALTGFTFPSFTDIVRNTSKLVNFTVQGNPSISTNPSTIVQFYYNVTTVPNSITKIILMRADGQGFVGDHQLLKGDIISFKNNDTINITLQQYTSGSETTLAIVQPNSEYNITFQNTGQFNYKMASPINLGTSINVSNNQIISPAHDPSLDKTLSFNYNLVYNRANVTITSVSPSNFTTDYNDDDVGAIVLHANDTAYNVRLSGDWFSFEENDFTMTANSNKVITFHVIPQIAYENNATNRTYDKVISVTTTNGDSLNQSVLVFINPYDFGSFTINGTQYVFTDLIINWTEGVIFCQANPDHRSCAGFPTIEKTVSAQARFNLSEDDFIAYLDKTNENADRMARVENSLVEYEQATKNTISSLQNDIAIQGELLRNLTGVYNDLLQEKRQDDKENELGQSDIKALIVTLIVLLITSLVFVSGYYYYVKHQKEYRI